MRQLPRFFAITRGRLFNMKNNRVWKVVDNYSFLPQQLAQDEKLSLQAKGLAAVICLVCIKQGESTVSTIELWKAITDVNGESSYKELVNAGYIEDFLKGHLQ
jgi:hypothetical protein